jgi:hypothetical protein
VAERGDRSVPQGIQQQFAYSVLDTETTQDIHIHVVSSRGGEQGFAKQ